MDKVWTTRGNQYIDNLVWYFTMGKVWTTRKNQYKDNLVWYFTLFIGPIIDSGLSIYESKEFKLRRKSIKRRDTITQTGHILIDFYYLYVYSVVLVSDVKLSYTKWILEVSYTQYNTKVLFLTSLK